MPDFTNREMTGKFDGGWVAGIAGTLHIIFTDELFVPVDVVHIEGPLAWLFS